MSAVAKLKAPAGESGTVGSPNNARHAREYLVFDAADASDAVGTAYTTAPATVTVNGTTLYRGSADWAPHVVDADGAGAYEVTVNYESQSRVPLEVGSVRIKVSTTGGTQHVTQSKQTVGVYPPDDIEAPAPDFGGAIGVTKDSVEGVDAGVEVFKFTVTKVFAPGSLPSLSALYAATWHTNDATFTVADTVTGVTITLLAGECVCQGVDLGDARSDGNVEVVYNFEASPNVTNMTIGDITGIDKKGWEYVWAYYVPVADGDGTRSWIIQKPVEVRVERVYDPADYTTLGL